MRALTNLLFSLSLAAALVAAHKEPKSQEEVEIQRALQAAAYHVSLIWSCSPPLSDRHSQCAPAVERYTAARKRSWAQKVLAGRPELPGYQDLFSSDIYDDVEVGTLPTPEDDSQTIMGCTPVSTSTIQNNTCVLSPVVTEGPYFHEAGHPIRQNIAETQDGLLLVCDVSYLVFGILSS